MTHEDTEPKNPSDNAEFFKGAARHQANQIYVAAKRLFDLCVVIAIAPAVLLTIVLAVLAILWTMGPPALVKLDRVGKGGRVFRQLKLRTCVEGASEHAPSALLGRLLEESCLADLPQLWNVLVGDMSIVGPRPESPQTVNFYRERLPNYELRQGVRPGITGYAQVCIRCANASTELDYDLHYIRHMDAALDLMILRDSLFPSSKRGTHV